MLQKADDQKDNDYQKAEYTTAKFKLITPPKSPSAALLLHIIQSPYFTKTPKQNLAYRHNNAFKGASIRILDARERSINYEILDIHRCSTNYGILDIHQYNINYEILNAHWYNDSSKILNASKIQAEKILDVALPEHPTEILDAPGINATEILNALEHTFTEILDVSGINATKILDALEHTFTKILDASGINTIKILDALEHIFTRILDAFRQNAIKILDARSRIIQAQTNPVRSQILNAAD
jgi:hypothetical protein